jgi:hypothetical protein
MKLTGFLLLPGGWIIVLTALALLPSSSAAQASFVLVALGVQALGMTLVIRAHLLPRERR